MKNLKNVARCIMTQSGNYLADLGHNIYAFVDKGGKFLRLSDYREYDNAEENWNYEEEILEFNSLVQVVMLHPDKYELSTERMHEDFSSFKPETGSNGGDYGFWENETTIKFQGKKFSYPTYHTTADFDYCETTGNFQRTEARMVLIIEDNTIYITGECVHSSEGFPVTAERIVFDWIEELQHYECDYELFALKVEHTGIEGVRLAEICLKETCIFRTLFTTPVNEMKSLIEKKAEEYFYIQEKILMRYKEFV